MRQDLDWATIRRQRRLPRRTSGASLEAGLAPAAVLEGPTPRLLDEWQLAPAVWNAMRRACDERGLRGQFILTGSADPPDDITRHSGAGRIARIRMRTMSLYESGESMAQCPCELFLAENGCDAGDRGSSLDDVLALACRGGWPQVLDCRPRRSDNRGRGLFGGNQPYGHVARRWRRTRPGASPPAAAFDRSEMSPQRSGTPCCR